MGRNPGMSTERISILLRDDNGTVIGNTYIDASDLDQYGQPIHVAIPWWQGSTRRYVVELRREGAPVLVDAAAAPLPEPADQGPDVPQLPAIPARPEHPELAAALADDGPGTVT